MKYMGSKNRHARQIIEVIRERSGGCYGPWVEPFVGGGNVIDKIEGTRLGFDANKWVIQALTSIRDHANDLPKNNREFTEEDYQKLRLDDSYPHKGFAGFAYSYGARWLGGWACDVGGRDYVAEGYSNAQKQSPRLQGVELETRPYAFLEVPPGSVVYCDPPYAGTAKYATQPFDHDHFWRWCRRLEESGSCRVFVSEYQAPDGWECVWEKNVHSFFGKSNDGDYKKATERLFQLKKP